VDGAGDEDAAAAVDDEGAVVVRDGRIGRGGQEGGRQESGEQDAPAAGDRRRRRRGHGVGVAAAHLTDLPHSSKKES